MLNRSSMVNTESESTPNVSTEFSMPSDVLSVSVYGIGIDSRSNDTISRNMSRTGGARESPSLQYLLCDEDMANVPVSKTDVTETMDNSRVGAKPKSRGQEREMLLSHCQRPTLLFNDEEAVCGEVILGDMPSNLRKKRIYTSYDNEFFRILMQIETDL